MTWTHEPRIANAPTGRNGRGVGGSADRAGLQFDNTPQAYRCSGGDDLAAPIEVLLGRLDRPRKTGRGWTARCPAHGDRTASLSIAEGLDGRVLLHCFAGCSAGDVVASLGLTLGNLFPRRHMRDMTTVERAIMREGAQQSRWRAALGVLAGEAVLIGIAAAVIRRGEPLVDEDAARLDQAIQRVESARAVLCGR